MNSKGLKSRQRIAEVRRWNTLIYAVTLLHNMYGIAMQHVHEPRLLLSTDASLPDIPACAVHLPWISLFLIISSLMV